MENNLYSIYVEIRKDDGTKFYDRDGNNVPHIRFEETIFRDFEKYCKQLYRQFEAITGCSDINISISQLSNMTQTYPVYYSYYGIEGRFITH